MITTIISNNCMGGVMCHRHNMKFKSPTVNLQILPEEFPKFCANLKHYIEAELVEYKELSQDHQLYYYRMYGKKAQYPNEIPIGIIDDIMVCFQHYDTFENAKAAWDKRKVRIDWDNIGYVFHAHVDNYWPEVVKFLDLNLPHSVALTNGFKVENSYRFDVPNVNGIDDFGRWNGKYSVEYGDFNEDKFLRGE